jgi:OPT family oligopeptide transporter
MGSVLGAILSVTNIYIGLKAGWGFGVAITACILSYAIWSTLYRIGIARTPMTILENNCMQTAASAAGYSTGGTLISAFAAYMMLTNQSLPMWELMAWVFLLAILGVTMAVPMKRQMVNIEQLPFPSGIAAAETLRALYSTSARGLQSAKALAIAGVLAMVSKLALDIGSLWERVAPYTLGTAVEWMNVSWFGPTWMGRTVMISWEPMFIAAGAITGMRVCASMLVGAVLCWMIYVPILQHTIDPATGAPLISAQGGFREVVQWTLWGGTACMVTSGILAFALQWKSALRAFRGLKTMFVGKHRVEDPVQAQMDAIETPGSWFVFGQGFALVGLCVLGAYTFQIPIWQTVIAVAMSFALALVACRVTGETDTTPIGAMGKITQLAFGALAPGKMVVNLMAANVTAGAAGSSAALLTDLKSGYLLGAHPRKQFLAQFSGIFIGTLVTVAIFKLLVPRPDMLGTEQFPAPAAQTWRAVAEALGGGLSSLHPIKIWSMAVGGLVGLILPILSMSFPRGAKYIPSAAGLGFAWVFQWYYSVLFFIGAAIGLYLEKRHKKWSDDYLFSIASGVIAGESLMGAGLAVAANGPEAIRQIFS